MTPTSRVDARHLRTLALALAAVALGWALAPVPEPAQPLVSPRADAWQMPTMPRHPDSALLAARATTAAFWGAAPATAAAAAAAAPPPDLRWRLSGTFTDGRRQGVLLVFMDPAKGPQRLFVGDKLPEDRVITAISGREVQATSGKGRKQKTETFKVERREN